MLNWGVMDIYRWPCAAFYMLVGRIDAFPVSILIVIWSLLDFFSLRLKTLAYIGVLNSLDCEGSCI